MRLNFGREGFIFFSFYRFQKIYPDNTIIEFPVILNQHKRKSKKRFPIKLIRFGKPRDFLDYREISTFFLESNIFIIKDCSVYSVYFALNEFQSSWHVAEIFQNFFQHFIESCRVYLRILAESMEWYLR